MGFGVGLGVDVVCGLGASVVPGLGVAVAVPLVLIGAGD